MEKRRISIEKTCDQQKRCVTFSKRRKGLFKKAQELCSLTGATITIIFFSEAGNPFTFCYPPPADDQNGDDGHGRLLSIMQQYYASSSECTITTANSQRAPVVEPKSIGEENMATGLQPSASDNESMWGSLETLYASGINASDPGSQGIVSASSWKGGDEQEMRLRLQLQSMHEMEVAPLDSVLAQPAEEGLVKSSSCNSFQPMSTNNCCYSWPSPLPSPSIEALLSSSSSSLSWNNNMDFLEMDAAEGAIMSSPFFSSF